MTSKRLRAKMKNIGIGRYTKPELSFSVITSAIFWFFVPFLVSNGSYWYTIYLRSSIWKYRRKKRLLKDDFQCVICNSSSAILDIHHLTYRRICRERSEDLTTICRNHHQRLHSK